MQKLTVFIFLLNLFLTASSQNEQFTIMQYNLTYYGNTSSWCTESNNNTTDKNTYLKTIIDELVPDIFGVNELGYNLQYAKSIQDNALNVSGRDFYDRSVINANSDISNLLYYNKNKFGMYSEDVISEDLNGDKIVREIDIHTLYYKAPSLAETKDTVFLTFILAHLKAGSDNSDLNKRDLATKAIMHYIDNNDVKGNIFMMGDFNVKTSSEASYQNFINYFNPDINFVDPINSPNWSGSSFANLHTQSTRDKDNTNGGCFVGGGMDDRFDFILMDNKMLTSNTKVKYVNGTYKAYGNDGNSYDERLRTSNNTVVSSTIAQALFEMSDHLPVIMDIEINTLTNISKIRNQINIQFANPITDRISIDINKKSNYLATIFDLTGKVIHNEQFRSSIQINTSSLNNGIYFLKIENETGDFMIEKIVK